MLSSRDHSYQGYSSQLKAGERLVMAADLRNNTTGRDRHQCVYIDNADEFNGWIQQWQDGGYYIIGAYAI